VALVHATIRARLTVSMAPDTTIWARMGRSRISGGPRWTRTTYLRGKRP